jgi:murein DD-endopeptidase MepM/ murein hydrolase activator NlpD
MAALAKEYILPVKGYHLTARFDQAGGHWSRHHTGLDFACPTGTAVHAVASGTVVSAGWDGPYGWKTVIRHADGTETWYAHQSQILVHKGFVTAGQVIGRVGATGNTTGPHLHLEVRINNIPVDPLTWLRAHGLRP